jgi:hypothetical protein
MVHMGSYVSLIDFVSFISCPVSLKRMCELRIVFVKSSVVCSVQRFF